MRSLFQKLIRTGLKHAQSDDHKFIITTNILGILFALINIGTVPGLTMFLPVSLPILLVQVIVGVLWPLVVILNGRGHFISARILFAVFTLVHMQIVVYFAGYDANTQFLILAGSNVPFFIHPPRYKKWMYLHVAFSLGAAVFWEVYPSMFGSAYNHTGLYLMFLRGLTIFGTIYVVFFSAFHHYNVLRQAEAELEAERAKSDKLLLNILPGPIAARLKAGERRIAEDIPTATVLFADLAGFTKLSSERNAGQIVEMLDGIFSEFDLLAQKYGLEKIKTIGDAYMVAGGVPLRMDDHAAAVARMALDMRALLRARPELFGNIQIRIGIHSGPVVAGVIGHHKFIYDLWGDTVNTASRMESHGLPGEIQVSREVFNALNTSFLFEERGAMEIKGKGKMDVFLLRHER